MNMVRFNKRRGQISIDFIFAMLFLMLVSTIVYYTELKYTNSTTNALIVNRMYSIADEFENYAVLSYSNNETVVLDLKPIGTLGYIIHVSNKMINVSHETSVLFTPTSNGIDISGDEVFNSGIDVGNKIIITTIIDNESINVSKNIIININ